MEGNGRSVLIQWPSVIHAAAYTVELQQREAGGPTERITRQVPEGMTEALVELRIGNLQPGSYHVGARVVAPSGYESKISDNAWAYLPSAWDPYASSMMNPWQGGSLYGGAPPPAAGLYGAPPPVLSPPLYGMPPSLPAAPSASLGYPRLRQQLLRYRLQRLLAPWLTLGLPLPQLLRHARERPCCRRRLLLQRRERLRFPPRRRLCQPPPAQQKPLPQLVTMPWYSIKSCGSATALPDLSMQLSQ